MLRSMALVLEHLSAKLSLSLAKYTVLQGLSHPVNSSQYANRPEYFSFTKPAWLQGLVLLIIDMHVPTLFSKS